MENSILNFQLACARVSALEDEIENAATLPYYEKYGRESEKHEDVANLKLKLRVAIGEKISALENLEIAINCEKAELNTQAGFLTMQKAG